MYIETIIDLAQVNKQTVLWPALRYPVISGRTVGAWTVLQI